MATQTPKIVEHDASTGETTIRDFTADELAQLKADAEAEKAQQEQRAAAKQAILDKLGLTQEEVAVLLG